MWAHRAEWVLGLALAGLLGCDDGAETRLHERVSESPGATASAAGGEGAGEGSQAPSEPAEASPRRGGGPTSRAEARAPDDPLLNPEQADETAPDEYTVKLETTKGEVLIDVHRDWAPRGADRFYNLVRLGFFDDTAFFRVVDGFVAQVGLKGEPAVDRAWRGAKIEDDPVEQSNTRGTVTFATSGEDSRTTQIFLNLGDNTNLDGMGFAPFGEIREQSMDVVESLYSGYGDGPPRGRGPDQARIQREGDAYLKRDFPKLDWIEEASVVEPEPAD